MVAIFVKMYESCILRNDVPLCSNEGNLFALHSTEQVVEMATKQRDHSVRRTIKTKENIRTQLLDEQTIKGYVRYGWNHTLAIISS